MIIDFHTHSFPEEIAARTIPKLAEKGNIKNYTNGTKEELRMSMKKADINYSIILPIATKPTQTEKINLLAAKTNETSKNTGLISFGSVHPDNENYRQILTEAKNSGIKGIKLHPYYQNTRADDEKIIRLVDCIENLGLITIFHAGLDVSFDDDCFASPEQFFNLYMKLKPERLVLAHMGGWRLWDDVEKLLCGLPIYLDTSFTLGKMRTFFPINSEQSDLLQPIVNCNRISDEQFIRIVKRHGADKILFGSDSPWSDQSEALEKLNNIGLTCDELSLIKGKNAQKLLNLN